MSLNGSEMSTGESIIIPIDISTLATTMSMMTNGMNTMNPIWKAVLSSLVAKAYFSVQYKDVAAFSILIGVLIFMPTGLLGRAEVEKV